MRLYGMGAMVVDFGDNPLLWIIGAAIAALSLFFKAVISKWGGESADPVMRILHRVYVKIKAEPVAHFVLLGVLSLSVYTYLSDRQMMTRQEAVRIFGPYKLEFCKEETHPYPMSGTTFDDYALLLGQVKMDSKVESGHGREYLWDNALYGFSVEKSDSDGKISLKAGLTVNLSTARNGDLRSCRTLSDDSYEMYLDQMFVEVFLLYPAPQKM